MVGGFIAFIVLAGALLFYTDPFSSTKRVTFQIELVEPRAQAEREAAPGRFDEVSPKIQRVEGVAGVDISPNTGK